MAHVIVIDSINNDLFVCGVCKVVFNNLQVFLDHKTTHSQSNISTQENTVNKSSGSIPDTLTDCKQLLQPENASIPPGTLLQQQGHKNNLTCNLCMKTFKKVASLLTHQKLHNYKPYQCPICGRCFILNSLLQRHLNSHKVWPSSLSETTPKSAEIDLLSYSCSYCETTVPNYNQYRIHLKQHSVLKMYKCIQGDCTTRFNSLDNLLHHIELAHKSSNYICHICKITFNCLEEIARHQQGHSGYLNTLKHVKQYKCSQCDAVFRKPDKLSLHLSTENHKKTCIHCHKIFASDKRLRAHLQVHRKAKPFSCDICGCSFHIKKYLSSHMAKHGERLYSCSICNHNFKRQDLLSRHMKGHQVKKLKCPFSDVLQCKMEFARSDKLKSHINSHTKHLTNSSTNQVQESHVGTLEICIVPLDNKDT